MTQHGRFHSRWALALFLAAFFACAGQAEANSPLSWSAPLRVDHQPPFASESNNTGLPAFRLNSMACPSATLCVSGAARGNVVYSTNPSGGATAWTSEQIADGRSSVGGGTCPSSSFCALVSGDGDVLTSTSPGSGAWTSRRLPGNPPLSSVACVSATFCVAVAVDGTVAFSANPTGTAAAWSVGSLGSTAALSDISCPAADLCVASDVHGRVWTSTAPASGAGSWTSFATELNQPTNTVACATKTICVVGMGANVLTSSNPSGGAAAWTPADVFPGAPYDISCPSATLCVAAASDGGVSVSTDPLGGASAWSGFSHPSTAQLTSVACRPDGSCVAGGVDGQIATTAIATASQWPTTRVHGRNWPSAVSCPTTTLCVAVDATGNVVSSGDPAGGSWNVAHVPGAAWLVDVSCPSATLCVAADFAGSAVTATTPTGGAAAWTLFPTGESGVADLQCISTTSCAATSSFDVAWSASPATGNWQHGHLNSDSYGILRCGRAGCFAFGSGGLQYSPNPAAGVASWVYVYGTRSSISAASCPAVDVCVTADGGTQLFRTSGRFSGADEFSVVAPDPTPISAIACPSLGLCIVGDRGGDLVSVTDPVAGVAAASGTNAARGNIITGIGCSNAFFCVAIDDMGNVMVGTAPAGTPRPMTVPAITGTVAIGSQLSCDPGSWQNAPTAISYRWLRRGRYIAGATAPTYVLQQDDVTQYVSCIATATNAAGETSEGSDGVVAPGIAPSNLTLPSVVVNDADGRLVCMSGNWDGIPGPSFGYQWLRDGQPIAKQLDVFHTVESADAGHELRCRVTAANVAGSASAISGGFAIPAARIVAGGPPGVLMTPPPTLPPAATPGVVSTPKPAAGAPAAVSVLTGGLRPPGGNAAIGALLHRRAWTATIRVPAAGRVRIDWKTRPTPTARAVLVAHGERSVGAGANVIKIALTQAGRRLLARASRVRITATATYIASGRTRASERRAFSLRR